MPTTATAADREPQSQAARVEPETVVPSQLFDTGIGATLQPEKRLMLAVLEDAVAVFQRHLSAPAPQGDRAFDETVAWIWSEDVSWPYSFLNVCEHLNLHGERMRKGLNLWAERRRAGLIDPVTINPFRRVSGTRHKTNGKAPGLKLRDVA